MLLMMMVLKWAELRVQRFPASTCRSTAVDQQRRRQLQLLTMKALLLLQLLLLLLLMMMMMMTMSSLFSRAVPANQSVTKIH